MKDVSRNLLNVCTIAFVACLVGIASFLATGYVVDDSPSTSVPPCVEEDGSTQEKCIWDDGSGLVVLNWNYGKNYSAYART